MKKVILSIDGMTCSACSNGLEKYLNKQESIKSATVNLVMNTASIEYDNTKIGMEDLNRFVAKAGFKSMGVYLPGAQEKKKRSTKIKLVIIAIVSILNLYVSMSHMVHLPSLPMLDMMDNTINYTTALFVLTTIVILLCLDVIRNGFKNLIHKTPNMDTLVSLGVLSSYCYSIFGMIKIFNGNMDMVHNLYFESASTVLFFIKLGKYIESRNKDKTKEAIRNLLTITPKDAVIERDGKEITVTIDEIQKGDIVVCKPGEKIAVDGIVIDGITHINESFITGESTPVKKEKDANVLAGSINYEGTIRYSAQKIGKESTVSEIVKMVVEATNTKAPIAKVADKISGYFVPVVIILAVISFLVWLVVADINTAINIFVSVLTIACPCSIGLATPLAIVISSGICSKKGILVKNSEVLENASKIKNIALDKTGTITKGELSVSNVICYSSVDEKEIIRIVASIEKKSEHPIAKAIVRYAREEKIEMARVQEFEAIVGLGVKAKFEDKVYYIGNRKLIENNNISLPNVDDENILTQEKNSILYLANENEVLALIGVKDILKGNIKEVIAKFKKKNINVVMLTGDNENTANAIAKEVGINEVISNVKPKEKARIIEEKKKDGITLMCGDGINDSVSLITADIGASISNGTDIAIDSASVVLMNDDLDKINDLIEISKKTMKNIKQNLFWAFIYNILMIPIAMGIFTKFGISLNPMIASFAMMLSSLTVVFNALRLRRIK